MRLLRYLITVGLIFCLLFSSLLAADKNVSRIEKVGDVPTKDLRVRTTLGAADPCIARNGGEIYWRIDGWVIGNELYKNYIDPEISCDKPYPYTITEINMPMIFDNQTPLIVSVDVELADTTNPECPVPGALIALSSTYEFQVETPGLYNIWIALDTPITVDGPFFAGFYIGNMFDDTVNVALVTDSFPNTICVSYNAWDSTGFYDLNNNEIYNFPGQVILYASGEPGGSGSSAPDPLVSIVTPRNNSDAYGQCEIIARDTSGSDIIQEMVFSYSDGGGFVEIGRDYDGTSTFRDDVNATGTDDGYKIDFDFSYLPEGSYTLRATAIDTLGRTGSSDVTVYLEPTPPLPHLIDPDDATKFCDELNLIVNCNDENLNTINFSIKEADLSYSNGLSTLLLSNFGNGYSSAIAAALGVKMWVDRNAGYAFLMRRGSTDLTLDSTAGWFADFFGITDTTGANDEDVIAGMYEYNADNGNALTIDYKKKPDYFDIRAMLEEDGRAVMLALGGAQGLWIAVDGFDGWTQPDGSYRVVFSNPLTATIDTTTMRYFAGNYELLIGSEWLFVDMMISFRIVNVFGTRTALGSDTDGQDGWSYQYIPSSLVESQPYFFRSEAVDANNKKGYDYLMVQYDCVNTYAVGDYNDDGAANLSDLNYLVDYYLNNGPAPIGGIYRADANCDTYLNITDVIYYVNYLFGLVSAPCN